MNRAVIVALLAVSLLPAPSHAACQVEGQSEPRIGSLNDQECPKFKEVKDDAGKVASFWATRDYVKKIMPPNKPNFSIPEPGNFDMEYVLGTAETIRVFAFRGAKKLGNILR